MKSEPVELLDALGSERSAERLRELDAGGLLTSLLPELEEGRAFAQPELHFFDVLEHNIAAVGALELALSPGEEGTDLRQAVAWIDLDASLNREVGGLPLRVLMRLGALLHDVAKPRTATIVEGRLRFPRHGPVGAEVIAARLPVLGFSPEATTFVSKLARYHLRPVELVKNWPASDRAVRRFTADLDGHVLPLMLINLADGMATRGPSYTRENFRRHCSLVNYVAARSWAAFEDDAGEFPPLVTGDDLIAELGLETGRQVGTILAAVRQAQETGSARTRHDALELARSVLESLPAN